MAWLPVTLLDFFRTKKSFETNMLRWDMCLRPVCVTNSRPENIYSTIP